jgi:tetratricopeptide (TPR) repeat protein
MSKNSQLLKLRLALDTAITYGTKPAALKLARQGLGMADKAKLSGEKEYFMGQLALLKGRFSEAIEHFDHALQHNLKDGAAYNDRALCMVELGIIDQALVYFDKGIKAEPDYATVYHNKGWLLNNIGRYSEGIACFKKALALEPRRAVTYDNLADALFNLGDYKGALAAYKKVLELLSPGACRGIRRNILCQMKLIKDKIELV